jgi:hypothetical protein
MTLGKVLLVCEAFSHLKRRRKEKTPAKSWPKRCCHGEILFVCVTVVTIYGFSSVLSKVSSSLWIQQLERLAWWENIKLEFYGCDFLLFMQIPASGS